MEFIFIKTRNSDSVFDKLMMEWDRKYVTIRDPKRRQEEDKSELNFKSKKDKENEKLWQEIVARNPYDLRHHLKGSRSQHLLGIKHHKQSLTKLTTLNLTNRAKAHDHHAKNLMKIIERNNPFKDNSDSILPKPSTQNLQ